MTPTIFQDRIAAPVHALVLWCFSIHRHHLRQFQERHTNEVSWDILADPQVAKNRMMANAAAIAVVARRSVRSEYCFGIRPAR